MTSAQIPERLLFDDESLPMEGEPLAPWLARERLFAPGARADCVRGYVGTWRLHGARLCLVALTPAAEGLCMQRERDERPVDISMRVLHGSERPVWADWFTGRLCCPHLPCVRYSEFGIPQTAQHDLVIDMVAGHARRIGFEATPPPPLPDDLLAAAAPVRAGAAAASRLRWPWPLPAWESMRRWHLRPHRPAL